MATTLNASTSSSGLVASGDSSGVLALQSSGVTGLSVGASGKVSLSSTSLGTASAGTIEYDGSVPYFTPSGTQRGIIPGMQYYQLNSANAGANVTTAQNVFGVGATLSSSTVYAFEAYYGFTKTSGSTTHNFQLLFGGTATLNSCLYFFLRSQSTSSFTDVSATNEMGGFIQVATATTLYLNYSSAFAYSTILLKGTVSVNAGGTFIPQYILSAAPGGAYTTAAGSYFLIYPIGASGANINVGTWA